MTAVFTAEEIMDICSGRLAAGLMPDEAGAVSADTRTLLPGQWYVALAGARFDGHDFLGDAFNAGAIGAIVLERGQYPIANPNFAIISVADTMRAYMDLAKNWYDRVKPNLVAVIRSSRAAKVKAMSATAIGFHRRCHSLDSNQSGEQGLMESILSMPPDTEVVVVEISLFEPSPVDELIKAIVPDTVIVATQNEDLITTGGIANEGLDLQMNLDPRRGIALVSYPSEEEVGKIKEQFGSKMICCNPDDFILTDLAVGMFRFRLPDSEQIFTVYASGIPSFHDAHATVIAARELGLADREIAAGLGNYRLNPISM